MDQEEVLRRVEEEVKREMMGREGSHDFHHVERVVALALKLAEEEGADPFIVHLSALVHDLYDRKEHPDDYLEKLAEFLEGAGVSGALQERVLRIVEEVSYRGGSLRPASAGGGLSRMLTGWTPWGQSEWPGPSPTGEAWEGPSITPR